MIRRSLLCAAAMSCALGPTVAWAQGGFPNKPVTLVVPNAPGGAVDILARLLEKQLNAIWKQPVLVVYKAGAGTVLGTDFTAKATPDGHTIGLVVTSHVINPSLRKNLPYDTLKDLTGVSMLATSPVVLAASPSLPAGNLKELIALAKKEPGKLTYASPGSGSSMHLAGELLKTSAGLDMLHAPYKGSGGAYPDVFAGRVDLLFDPLFSSLPHIKAGKMKPIAVLSPKREAIAPDIPAAAETLPGFVVQSVFGAVVASGTPPEIVSQLSADLARALQSPEMKARMADIALTPVGSKPEEFNAYIRSEIDRWAKVVKASSATAD
ncbi:tripartite tricarboxylate transporter substrate binding protein [Azohydromonas australica]|uniref:tripartite tricarboxylate transporter substrate binding protein n=1 Tax=Azohydromonas australica TaxID=364039 RepID=UPI000408BD48|nr:tripartite tricarboxylate transporter substrate binding protein [Azohydromonas australica]